METERHFWGNVHYATNADAKTARDQQARAWRQEGYAVTCERLPNQLRQYASFGVPDGTIGHVYIVRRRMATGA